MKKGFSLVELLIALAILAIVVAIIIPKYLNTRRQAMWAIALNMEVDFNKALDNWRALGGTLGSDVYTSDILDLFASNSKYSYQPDNSTRKVVDGNTSSSIRMGISPDAETRTKLDGGSRRGCFLNKEKTFMAVYNTFTGKMGVVAVIDGKIPCYYWGTGDSNREILQTAVGETTVVVLQVSGKLCYIEKALDYNFGTGIGTVRQCIENKTCRPATQNIDIGVDTHASQTRSIAVFKKKLDSNNVPLISDDWVITEDFFGSAQQNVKWAAALANIN